MRQQASDRLAKDSKIAKASPTL